LVRQTAEDAEGAEVSDKALKAAARAFWKYPSAEDRLAVS
jgi:hypothetical protein